MIIHDQPVWEKPKTNKLYLQPYHCERLICLYPDFKVTNTLAGIPDVRSFNDTNLASALKSANCTDACGVWFLEGEEGHNIDWMKSTFTIREDGIPVHAVHNKNERYSLTMEAFCQNKADPKTYVRFIVTNTSTSAWNSRFCMVPRTGDERYISNIHWDGYLPYKPHINLWNMLYSGWHNGVNCTFDDKYIIRFAKDECISLEWKEKQLVDSYMMYNFYQLTVSLGPGESANLFLEISNDKEPEGLLTPEVYYEQRSESILAWEAVLGKITSYPDVKSDYFIKMFKSLVCQCMQMLAKFQNNDTIFPRQGGVSKMVWPWEAAEFLIALDRIGLNEYTRDAYLFFRDYLQVKEGENKGKLITVGIEWAAMTGAYLWGLCQHILLSDDRQVYDNFIDSLMDGFEWMEKTRLSTLNDASYDIGRGLFPRMRSTDWEGDTQSWCFTDPVNITGYRWLMEVLKHYNDPRYDKVKAAFDEYMKRIREVLKTFVKNDDINDEIFFTNQLGHDIKDPPTWPYFVDGPLYLVRYGVIAPDEPVVKQVENYFKNRNLMKKGLTGSFQSSIVEHIPSDLHPGYIWYVTTSEIAWFYVALATGNRDRARELLYAMYEYAMSEEFYMVERYASNDPAYAPWSPNASANGRLINMMLDFYK